MRQKKSVRVNEVKEYSRIIKQGSSFENLLSTVTNLNSDTNTTKESTEYFLQGILSLHTDTINNYFFRWGRRLVSFPTLITDGHGGYFTDMGS